MIIECTQAFVEGIAKFNLSPPFRFGRVVHKGRGIDRVFVGLCSEREMRQRMLQIEALIESGGTATERRLRGLS